MSEQTVEGEQDEVYLVEPDPTEEQDEPLDLAVGDRRLVTQPYDLSVRSLADDIERGRIQLNIEYQREYVWDDGKASRLIESLLLNVPVPVCYFAENEDGTYEVIDGLQRITTVNRFVTGQFSLRGLSVLTDANGKKFDGLVPADQRRLENRTIRCVVITSDSHPDIKFDVFERLNTGSAMLNAQELRNCIYRGTFNEQLREIARSDELEAILDTKSNRRMDHEELALRYFALRDQIADYKPPLRQFLNTYMRDRRTTGLSDDEISDFKKVCRTIEAIFGSSAFRVSDPDGKLHRAVNKALFDSIMVSTGFSDQDAMQAAADEVRALRVRLLDDEDFQTAIGRATADRTRMRARIRQFSQGLADAGVHCDALAFVSDDDH